MVFLETIIFGGFGPVVSDGFGIGYNVVDSKVGAVVTSYKVYISKTFKKFSCTKILK